MPTMTAAKTQAGMPPKKRMSGSSAANTQNTAISTPRMPAMLTSSRVAARPGTMASSTSSHR